MTGPGKPWNTPPPHDDLLPPDPDPEAQVQDAREYLALVSSGRGLMLPWADLVGLVGPLLPGWLVVVGGRGKAGKTTVLQNLLSAWTEMGKRCLYVCTEQTSGVMRIIWACLRTGLSVEHVVDRYASKQTVPAIELDLAAQMAPPLKDLAVFGDTPRGTVQEVEFWIAYAYHQGFDVFLFDHVHRLETGDGDAEWAGYRQAVRRIKNAAKDFGMLVVTAAQLREGSGNHLLSEHEVPGNASWYGGSVIQREADLAIQVWRPFKPGTTEAQKREVKDTGDVLKLIQENVMAVRVAAARYRPKAMNQTRRLYVRDGRLESFTVR